MFTTQANDSMETVQQGKDLEGIENSECTLTITKASWTRSLRTFHNVDEVVSVSSEETGRMLGESEHPIQQFKEYVTSREIMQEQSAAVMSEVEKVINPSESDITAQDSECVEYLENSDCISTINTNEAMITSDIDQQGSLVQDIQAPSVIKLESQEHHAQISQEQIESIGIPQNVQNRGAEIQDLGTMLFENVGGVIPTVQQSEASIKCLENSESGLTVMTNEAEMVLSKDKESDQGSLFSLSTGENSESLQLPVQLLGNDVHQTNVSGIFPSIGPCTSGNTFTEIPDFPVSKVRLSNSSDVHVGTRINYVTKVLQAPPSSKLTCEDLKKNDDVVLQATSKLRLWYSTENAYMPSLVCYERSHDFPIRDCYLPLKVTEYNNLGTVKRENVPLKNIFISNQCDIPPKRILLTGNPGCGKTSILRKLAFDWATLNSENNYMSNFDVVLIINLVTLLDRTVEEMLLDALFENRDDKRQEILHKTKLQFLILLDGFDDLVTSNPVIDFLTAKRSCVFSANMTIVVTSRYHSIIAIKKCFQRHFHIEGFSEEEKERYIDFRFSEKEYMKESFKCKLEREKPLSEISKNPLMLHMLCCLHEEQKLGGHTETYTEIFSSLIRRYHQKRGWSIRGLKRGKYLLGESLLGRFGKIALWCLRNDTFCIRRSAVKQEFPNHDEYEFITQLGFLVISHDCRCQLYCLFDVIHTRFLEYTAAIYLTQSLENLQSVLSLETYDDFDIASIIIFLMNMCDDTGILIAILDPVEFSKKICFDDYYRIIKEINNVEPFLETLDCCYLESSASNLSHLLDHNKTKQLTIHFPFSEFSIGHQNILSSIKGSSSLRKLKIEKSVTFSLYLCVDTWCVSWFIDMLDDFEFLKEILSLESDANITIQLSPRLYQGGIRSDGWYSGALNTVDPSALPEHEHLEESLTNCYRCVVAYQHEINISFDRITFILPVYGYYMFDCQYKKLVIIRVPENDHTLFKEDGIFLQIVEGFLANNIDIEIW